MKLRKISKLFVIGLSVLSLVACNSNKDEPEKPQENQPVLNANTTQLDFEESYIKGTFSYEEGGKFLVSVLSSISSIAAGIWFEQEPCVVAGIMGIISSFNDQFAGGMGPTMADVMDKLNEMDKKLDTINAKLDQNYNQLMTETIRTQAKVDQVLLEEMENAIANFNTSYVVPIENYTRDYSDYMAQSFKAYVNKAETEDVYVYQYADFKWSNCLINEDKEGKTKITIEINDFPKSKAHLSEHSNIVTEGFMDCFYQDIDTAVENIALPKSLNRETFRNFVAAQATEKFTQKYYVDNHQKALDIRNLVINFAKQISGKSVKSIIDRYAMRMEYMYNFVGEMKNTVTDLFSNLMYNLDTYTALAAQACSYAEVNVDEVRSEFIAARELIQNYYENINKLDSRYCFLTNTILDGGFYSAKYDVSYRDKGNECKLKANFVLNRIYWSPNPQWGIDDINTHNFVNEIDHLRIVTRYNLMKAIGITTAPSYVEYLVSTGVMQKDSYECCDKLIRTKYIGTDALRFLTGINIRNMDNSDKNFKIQCMDSGNPDGDYFHIGWEGTFRQKEEENCWSGKIVETIFLDAKTGEIQDDKRVAAYCTYNESHWYWSDDEHWAFIDNPAGNYFFILESISA